jgi:hypothetical protein
MLDFDLIKIFVEGSTDQGLIQYILENQFNVKFSTTESVGDAIIDCKGWTNLEEKLRIADSPKRIQENGVNLVVFDADSKKKKGGFAKRKAEIEERIAGIKIQTYIFLFPNNQTDGDLEDFYCSCMKEEYSFFNHCWDEMISCFEKNKNELILKIPKAAEKVFSYVDLFRNYKKENYKNTKTKRSYFDSGLWAFDFENNLYLKSLVDFLKEHIRQK